MNIKLVYSFLALCKYKKVTVASKKLNISHQGLSNQIQALETDLDIKLFNRQKNGVTLTEEGVKLYSYFKDLSNSYEALLGASNRYKKTSKKIIKVGVAQGVTSAIGLDFLMEFKKDYPNVDVDIIELYDDQCLESLMDGKVDFAFLVEPFEHTDLKSTLIYEDEPYVAINKAHPLAKRTDAITMQDLHNQPLLILDEQYNLRNTFDKMCEEMKIQPVVLFSANTVASYLNLANEVEALAVIMKFIIPYVDEKNVAVLPLLDGPQYKVHFAKKSQNVATKHAEIFEQYVLDFF